MAEVTSRDELKEYCLRRLGSPVIKINVDDTQIEDRIDEYVNKTGFYNKKASIINYVNNLYSKIEWAKRQAYIALAFGMAAAMELNIASCPMEGFKPDEISQVLQLDTNLKPCVLLTVGNKRNDYELEKRFRFSKEDIFTLYN